MTEKELEIKKLLFGNQKQANAINDAVVSIVTDLFEKNATPREPGVEPYQAMYNFISELTATGHTLSDDESLFIQLVCGKASYETLKSGVPFIVTCDQPSTESPKYNFRITTLGEEAEEEPDPSTSMHVANKPTVGPDEVYSDDDDFATRARKIKDAILPMVPTGVKAEIPDNEYAQALCCAEYYYGYK